MNIVNVVKFCVNGSGEEIGTEVIKVLLTATAAKFVNMLFYLEGSISSALFCCSCSVLGTFTARADPFSLE